MKKKLKTYFYPLLIFFVILFAIWSAGFSIYMFDTFRIMKTSIAHVMENSLIYAEMDNSKYDAIVVVTGSKGRIEEGLSLFHQRKAPILLISGVGKGVSEESIRNRFSEDLTKQNDEPGHRTQLPECCIILDYKSKNTCQNAKNTAKWAQENDIKSILLVSTFYHMPRTKLEFSHKMPDIKITPVIATKFTNLEDSESFEEFTHIYALMISEYHKLIVTLIRQTLPEKLFGLPACPENHSSLTAPFN